MVQTLIVGLLVLGCAGYASWTLMPAAARRGLAASVLRLPLPTGFQATLRRAATASIGCGCDGCDHAPAASARPKADAGAAPQIVKFHPRPHR